MKKVIMKNNKINLSVERFGSVRHLMTLIFLIFITQLLTAQNLHFSETEIINEINPYHSIIELTNNGKDYQAILVDKKDNNTIQEIEKTRNWYKLLEKRPIQIDTKVIYYETIAKIKKYPFLKKEYIKEATIYIESIDKTITKEVEIDIGLNSDTLSFHIKALEFVEILKPNNLAVLPAPYLEYAKNAINPIYAKILTEDTNGKIEYINILKSDKEKIKRIENSINGYEPIENQIIKIDTLTTLWIKIPASKNCLPSPDCMIWVLALAKTKTTDTIKVYLPKKIDARKLSLDGKSVNEILVFPNNDNINQGEPLLFDRIMKTVFEDFYENNLRIHFMKNVFGTGKYLIQINQNNKVLASKIIQQ